MNDKDKNFILLRILEQNQQDSAGARDGIKKTISTICGQEGISFEQVFHTLFIDATFISNKLSFSLYFDQFLE